MLTPRGFSLTFNPQLNPNSKTPHPIWCYLGESPPTFRKHFVCRHSTHWCPFNSVLSQCPFAFVGTLRYTALRRYVDHESTSLPSSIVDGFFPSLTLSVSIKMAARINVNQSASRRGGVIYNIEGKRYYCAWGKMHNPIEENVNQEEVELINPTLLGRPKYTPLYLKCCNCNVRGTLKELEDGSYIDLALHGGKLCNSSACNQTKSQFTKGMPAISMKLLQGPTTLKKGFLESARDWTAMSPLCRLIELQSLMNQKTSSLRCVRQGRSTANWAKEEEKINRRCLSY